MERNVQKRVYECIIHIPELLCCKLETNTTLYINYISIKSFFFFKKRNAHNMQSQHYSTTPGFILSLLIDSS